LIVIDLQKQPGLKLALTIRAPAFWKDKTSHQ